MAKGRLTELVRRLAREKRIKEYADEYGNARAGYIGDGLYGDGDYADAYADVLPTPFGEQHLHLNWRWGNYYWRITTQHNKLCGTNRCRRVHIEIPEYHRADGGVECRKCGLPYRLHPMEPFILGWSGMGDSRPFLNRLCDGTLVKL